MKSRILIALAVLLVLTGVALVVRSKKESLQFSAYEDPKSLLVPLTGQPLAVNTQTRQGFMLQKTDSNAWTWEVAFHSGRTGARTVTNINTSASRTADVTARFTEDGRYAYVLEFPNSNNRGQIEKFDTQTGERSMFYSETRPNNSLEPYGSMDIQNSKLYFLTRRTSAQYGPTADFTIYKKDLTTGEQSVVRTFAPTDYVGSSGGISVRGSWIYFLRNAYYGNNNTSQIWRLNEVTGAEELVKRYYEIDPEIGYAMGSLRISSDGRYIAFKSYDGLRVMDMQTPNSEVVVYSAPINSSAYTWMGDKVLVYQTNSYAVTPPSQVSVRRFP